MLTNDEKQLLEDQDGPLGGRPLFESVWRANRELGQAFLEYCEAHRPARYIDWLRELKDGDLSNNFSESLIRLELSTRDMGETISSFLSSISATHPSLSEEAITVLKAALGTERVPVPENRTPVQERDLLRAVHAEADRLIETRKSGKPYSEESIVALHEALGSFRAPPVEPRQFSALMGMFTDLNGLFNDPARIDRIAQFIHFNMPYHEPVLREFTRWCEDPNRLQSDVVEVGISDWVPKLIMLAHEDRQQAARTMREVITSSTLEERLKVFVQALELD